MTPSVVDQNPAPPGYTSQRDVASLLQSLESRSNGSTDDLVSAQSHPQASPSIDIPAPRHSDVQFNEASASRTNTDRRRSRYASLSYDSPLTTPEHLQYTHGGTTPTSTGAVSEYTPDTPNSMSLREKMASQSTVRLNPTNYVSLSRKSTPHKRFLSLYRARASIKGPFTVNPYLHIPAALLSPSSNRDGEVVRKNLRLEVENGGIDVDIFLVGEPSQDTASSALRATLDLKIRGGAKNRFPLIAKLVRVKPVTKPCKRLTDFFDDSSIRPASSVHHSTSVLLQSMDTCHSIYLPPSMG